MKSLNPDNHVSRDKRQMIFDKSLPKAPSYVACIESLPNPTTFRDTFKGSHFYLHSKGIFSDDGKAPGGRVITDDDILTVLRDSLDEFAPDAISMSTTTTSVCPFCGNTLKTPLLVVTSSGTDFECSCKNVFGIRNRLLLSPVDGNGRTPGDDPQLLSDLSIKKEVFFKAVLGPPIINRSSVRLWNVMNLSLETVNPMKFMEKQVRDWFQVFTVTQEDYRNFFSGKTIVVDEEKMEKRAILKVNGKTALSIEVSRYKKSCVNVFWSAYFHDNFTILRHKTSGNFYFLLKCLLEETGTESWCAVPVFQQGGVTIVDN